MEEFRKIIDEGIAVWERLKKDFADDEKMLGFLKKSVLVVMIDSHQIDIDKARGLDSDVFGKLKDPTQEEIKAEAWRKKILAYYRKEAHGISVEVRFPFVKIEFIQKLKEHEAIRALNSPSPASIRVALKRANIDRQKKTEKGRGD